MPSQSDHAPPGPAPADVIAWFDRTYRTRGERYLRPFAAYPIYLQLLAARRGESLLDVGCGPGLLLAAALQRGVRACGVDVAPAALALARRRAAGASVVRGAAEALPFAGDSFDLITCIGVLERVFDRQRALAELRRIGKPGARICLLVRNAQSLSWRLRRAFGRQDHASHQDAATLEDWRSLFEGAGFTVTAVHIDQWWRQRVRRLWRGQPDFARDEPVAQPILPLRCALEFLFLLRRPAP